jgi:hypothetical protein
MRLTTYDQFVEKAANASIRLVDGKIYVGSSDVVRFSWEERLNYVLLARRAFETIVSEEQILFFHEFGIWPSSENRYLFKTVVKSLFDLEVENPTQFFHFTRGDNEAVTTLLQIGLQSGWGGLLFGEDNNWFYFDHDGFGMIASTANLAEILGPVDGLTILPNDFRRT